MSQFSGQVPTEADSRPTGAVDTARQEAADVTETARAEAGHVVDTAKQEASHVAHEAKAQLKDVYSQTQRELRDQAAAQQRRVAEGLRSVGDELESLAAGSENPGVATDIVRQASTRLKGASTWLDDRDPGSLMHEVTSFARRRPGVFIAGALLAGLAAGRLTRALAESGAESAQGASAERAADVAAAPTAPAVPAAAPTTTAGDGTPSAAAPGGYGEPGAPGAPVSDPLATPSDLPPSRGEGTPVYDRSRAERARPGEGIGNDL
ncbi:hypothetical protein GCM10017576_03720 [Microbacterium barkeri]|uniref:DUF3618 domain-containing protein n=1 Tax=Microbacterium barkeri TaxID=33917 RepID=A0A9W6H0X2_9MICO|nr:hypothetical protein [Microbacterium barkeri]MDR6876125.1 vacuolar-type H+-ATPase subunit H [Microbacterium barkeri]GLJ60243.1 hypothetical protein GCM10017576_03720 [Microbacterium barkeri]